jgi:hypothetical protein
MVLLGNTKANTKAKTKSFMSRLLRLFQGL